MPKLHAPSAPVATGIPATVDAAAAILAPQYRGDADAAGAALSAVVAALAPPDDLAALAENAGRALAGVPGFATMPGAGFIDPSGPDGRAEAFAESVAGFLDALAGLVVTTAPLAAVSDAPAPVFVASAPRLRFVRADAVTGYRGVPSGPGPGEVVRRCYVTGAAFVVPAGAPVPALVFSTRGAEPDGDDLGERAEPVHPALAAAGERAVVAALYDSVRSLADDALGLLVDAVTRATLARAAHDAAHAGGFTADGLADALVSPATPTRAAAPAGWRGVDRSAALAS